MSEGLSPQPEALANDPSEVLGQFEQSLSDPGQTEALVQERLTQLEQMAVSTEISMLGKNPYSGFIHPDSRVVRNIMVDPFKVNDPEAYQYLVGAIREFKAAPGWSELDLRKLSLPVVQHAIANYFGNFVSGPGTESQNRQFYLDHTTVDSNPIDLAEFKGQGLAVCAEKAALAQNFLTLLGYDAKMIMSRCVLGQETEEGHSFQLVTTERGAFIYDPTNPSLILNAENQAIGQYPAFYQLSAEQKIAIENGESIEVTHYDSYDKPGEDPERRATTRVYSGKK